MTSLAGAAVALVILVDLATGQGPPIYTNYLQAQNYRGPPPPSAVHPQRVEYSSKKADKELEKAIELGKVGDSPKGPHGQHEKKFEKEFEETGRKDYGKKANSYTTTAAPGMLSSLSNSMSDAWSRFSSLGRSTRSVGDDENRSVKNETTNKSGAGKIDTPASSGRGIDSYEYLQQRQNGYIYFKVPKHLVCNY